MYIYLCFEALRLTSTRINHIGHTFQKEELLSSAVILNFSFANETSSALKVLFLDAEIQVRWEPHFQYFFTQSVQKLLYIIAGMTV